MTPVYKLSASSIKGRTNYGRMSAGNAPKASGGTITSSGGY